jgi:ABC-2 type transport system ATP-binding protein
MTLARPDADGPPVAPVAAGRQGAAAARAGAAAVATGRGDAGAGIALDGVSRWFGNVVAVNDVSFSVGPGVTGLLGPNGAGKSTILNILAGLLRPSAGRATVDGRPTWRDPEVYRRLGLVPEREAMPGYLTGEEFVVLRARLQEVADPRAATQRALEAVELVDVRRRPIGTYSKGMRQRVKLAGALVHEPTVLLLDEPFNGLDPRQRLHMIGLLRRMADAGRTILFSSHILEEVERLAERILVIYAGRLAAAGDPREIRRLMTDRPHTFTVRSSDDRRLASALIAEPAVIATELTDGLLSVRGAEYRALTRLLPRAARTAAVSLFEVRPTDESLESVFAYLVAPGGRRG